MDNITNKNTNTLKKLISIIISGLLSFLFTFLIFPIIAFIGFKTHIMPLLYIGGIVSLVISLYYYLPKILSLDIITIGYIICLFYMSLTKTISYLNRFEIFMITFSIGLFLYVVIEYICNLLFEKNNKKYLNDKEN